MPIYSNIKFPDYVYQEYPKWVDGVLIHDKSEEYSSDNVTNIRSEAAKAMWAKRKAAK